MYSVPSPYSALHDGIAAIKYNINIIRTSTKIRAFLILRKITVIFSLINFLVLHAFYLHYFNHYVAALTDEKLQSGPGGGAAGIAAPGPGEVVCPGNELALDPPGCNQGFINRRVIWLKFTKNTRKQLLF